MSILRIAFDKKSRDITHKQAIARARVTSVEWRNLEESTLFSRSIARDKVRFTRMNKKLVFQYTETENNKRKKKKNIHDTPKKFLKVMEDRFPFLIMTFYDIILLSYDTLQPINNF